MLPRCGIWKFWNRCTSDAPRNSSLYGALNRTVTPMGARRLRDWLSQPLADVGRDSTTPGSGASVDGPSPACSSSFRTQLAEVRDLERTIGRLSVGSGQRA